MVSRAVLADRLCYISLYPVSITFFFLPLVAGLGCSQDIEVTIEKNQTTPDIEEPSTFSPFVDGMGSVFQQDGEQVAVDFVSGYFYHDALSSLNRVVVASWDVECGDSFYSEDSHSIMVVLSTETQVSHANIIYTIDTFSNAIFQVATVSVEGNLNQYHLDDIIDGEFVASGAFGEVSLDVHGAFSLQHCGVL